jgi:nucleoside-diphosphate-sugar epimerase
MKALVTGATGFIGSQIVDYLLERGYEVRCTIRKSSNLRWLKDKPIELVEASLNDKEALKKAVQGVDYIFHIAGVTAAKNYDVFLKANRDGTRNLLEAVAESEHSNLKRFLHCSSLTVSGPAESLDKPSSEDMPCKPITSYGKSKKAGEDEVRKFIDKFPITIVRPPAVYGPRDEDILDVFKTVKAGLGTMIGFSPKYVSLIHSYDLARGIIEAAESDNTIGKTYNVSSEEFYTWNQIMPIMKKALGVKFYIGLKIPHFLVLTIAGISGFIGKFMENPPVFNYEKGIDFIQSYWIGSVEAAKRDFGYRQKVSIEEGMKITADWYKEHNWL